MNVTHVSRGITFEWDSYKASSNLRKHGISFEAACKIFSDPFVDSIDDEYIDGELRAQSIGMLPTWQLLCVVYVMRGDRVRVISARRATNPERHRYENR